MLIFHSNDVHGEYGRLERLLEEYRRSEGRSLWFDSGDALSGSNTVFRWREPVFRVFNNWRCAAMAVGNRDFNYWRWVMRRRHQQRRCPLLCANMLDLRYPENVGRGLVREAEQVESSAPDDGLASSAPLWHPYLELTLTAAAEDEASARPLRLGVIGITVVQYPVGSGWEKVFGLRFLDPQQVIPPLAQRLAERLDGLIILSHLGLDRDRELAPSLPARTLILGGHTHTVLQEPVTVGDCWIVQGGAHARYLGRLDYDIGSRTLRDYRLLSLAP